MFLQAVPPPIPPPPPPGLPMGYEYVLLVLGVIYGVILLYRKRSIITVKAEITLKENKVCLNT